MCWLCWLRGAKSKYSNAILIMDFTNMWMQWENPTLSICSHEGNISNITVQVILTLLGSFSVGSKVIVPQSVYCISLLPYVLHHRVSVLSKLALFSPLDFNSRKLLLFPKLFGKTGRSHHSLQSLERTVNVFGRRMQCPAKWSE